MSWQLLLGYLPTSSERRVVTLDRKRKEYLEGVRQAFERGPTASSISSARTSTSAHARSRGLDEALWHQISIDVPRTSPHLQLYSYEATQRSLERILYVWAIRHPASGYVQGINDLVTPFWQVFLSSYITDPGIESGMDPGQLPRPVLDAVEADAFWCLSKLLDGIQDNYIFAQPGIVRQVGALKDLTTRIDSGLAKHLEREGVEFMQFGFRWVNCLLMREFPVGCIIRMWDTYLAEEQGFSDFHLYVCAAFLVKWSEQLTKMEFQVSQSTPSIDLILFFFFKSNPFLILSYIGHYDVPASLADANLDRKGRRVAAQRGLHLAELVPRLERTSEEELDGRPAAAYGGLGEYLKKKRKKKKRKKKNENEKRG